MRYSFDEESGNFVFYNNIRLGELRFTRKQILMVCKACLLMAASDGHICNQELTSIKAELLQMFDQNETLVDEIIREAKSMDVDTIFDDISQLNEIQKTYTTALLITVMSADRKIDDGEKTLLQVLSIMCRLPEMSFREAHEIMSNL